MEKNCRKDTEEPPAEPIEYTNSPDALNSSRQHSAHPTAAEKRSDFEIEYACCIGSCPFRENENLWIHRTFLT